MKCPVMSCEMSMVCSNFGQPVHWSSGLFSCVAGEFVWYFLLRSLLALGWCLVSVKVWRLLDYLLSINVPWSQEFSGILRFGV